jgi:phenylacetate-coenzyme A ligase PaaK-like adenylate-forming protein
LIRYEVGDEVALCPGDDGLGLARFDRVIGRCNAFLLLPDGTRIHSEAITHVVSGCTDVGAYQAVQEGERIAMLLTAGRPIAAETIAAIRGRLAKIHPELGRIEVRQADRLRQTIAGKTPMILRRASGTAETAVPPG